MKKRLIIIIVILCFSNLALLGILMHEELQRQKENAVPDYPAEEIRHSDLTVVYSNKDQNVYYFIPCGANHSLVKAFAKFEYVPSDTWFDHSVELYHFVFDASPDDDSISMIVGENSLCINGVTYVPSPDNNADYHKVVLEQVEYWYQLIESGKIQRAKYVLEEKNYGYPTDSVDTQAGN